MKKGLKPYATRGNKGIVTLLRRKGYTITDLCKYIRSSGNKFICPQTAYKFVNNPCFMTYNQLLMFSAMVDTPFIETIALIHSNRSKVTLQDKQSLQSIITKVEQEQGKK